MNCRNCNTPFVMRRIKYGTGCIEMRTCECEAKQIEARHAKPETEKPEHDGKANACGRD